MIVLVGKVILVVGPCFSALRIFLASPFWPTKFLLRNQLRVLWELPCSSLIAFFSLLLRFSLSLTLGIVITKCLGVGLFEFILFRTLCASCTCMSIFFTRLGKFLSSFFKEVFQLLTLFPLLHPHNANVGMLEVIPEAPYTILILRVFFFLFLFGCFFFLIFQITVLIFGFTYSAVDFL